MKFKHLTIDDIRNVLSEDEIQSLNSLSLDVSKTEIINNIIDLISDTWRGTLQSKGYRLDIRDHYTPIEYSYYILVHSRWAIWTRFNLSPSIGLDDARKEEYKKSMELLKNPYIGISKPEWEFDPTNPINGGSSASSITVPFLRFDEYLMVDNILTY